jgi:hypothetical protein
MKKNLDEILSDFRVIVGDNDSDEVIAFIEDLTDSYTPTEDNSGRIAELEGEIADWRRRYRDRFYGKVDERDVEEFAEDKTVDEPTGETIKIKDIFKEKE